MSVDPELHEIHLETLQELKALKVRIYRGLHINADRVSSGAVDSFLNKQSASPEAWERVINHIHVIDGFWGISDVSEITHLAHEIAKSWKTILSTLDDRYHVFEFEDDNGPGLTFYLDRSGLQSNYVYHPDMPHSEVTNGCFQNFISPDPP